MPSREDLDLVDCEVMDTPALVRDIAEANELNNKPLSLKDDDFDALIAFLHALTDKRNIDLRSDVPKSVPSGLTLAE